MQKEEWGIFATTVWLFMGFMGPESRVTELNTYASQD